MPSNYIMYTLLQHIALLIYILPFIHNSNNQIENDYKTYTIQKGNHRSINAFEFVNTNQFRFEVIFDSTAIYQTKTKSNQADINKLYGFSDCFSSHHDNSARFGWRWYQENLELFAYCYVNGKRVSELIDQIDLNRSYICEIDIQSNKYIFKVNNIVREVSRSCNGNGFGYKLYPYFGGDETAPHDIFIRIKDM